MSSALRFEVTLWFDELRLPVFRYLVYNGAGRADAEEIVQETFLRLYTHLLAGEALTNVRAWVFEVARNLSRDRQKSGGRKRVVGIDVAAACVDPHAGPEEHAIRNERTRHLHAAIAMLSDQQRECLLLRMSGLRYREIAEVLEISVSGVGQLIARTTVLLGEKTNE